MRAATDSFSRRCLIACVVVIASGWCAAAATANPPEIRSEGISGLTESSAILEADIVPGSTGEGDEEGDWEWGGAWYQFQLATDPAEFWPEVTCPEDTPESPDIQCLGPMGVPGNAEPFTSFKRRPGDLPTKRLLGSQETKHVALDLASVGVDLEPGHTYHYRVIAVEAIKTVDTISWRTPPVYGPDQTFTTLSPFVASPLVSAAVDQPPAVQSEPAPPRRHRCRAHAKLRLSAHARVHCRRAVGPTHR